MVHIVDWYATFAFLAGVNPTDKMAAKAGTWTTKGRRHVPHTGGCLA